MNWTPDVVMYHDKCADGFGAALAVYEANMMRSIEYVPVQYGAPAPAVDIHEKRVLIADFSFPAEVIREMCKRAHSVVLLDHHKTAEEQLSEFTNMASKGPLYSSYLQRGTSLAPYVAFDMNVSGAVMAWSFINNRPYEEAPLLLQHIQDRDLWRFQMEGTSELEVYLKTMPWSLDEWHGLMHRMEKGDTAEVFTAAKAMAKFRNKLVDEISLTAHKVTFYGHENVPIVYTNYSLASNVANRVLQLNPEAPFAVAVICAYGGTSYSLRSEDHRVDVSAVAKAHGGGGHRNAAGFRKEEESVLV